ncbi:MAG: hypothetical protein Q9198_002455, partial [Flavoplaca austrocitrina]
MSHKYDAPPPSYPPQTHQDAGPYNPGGNQDYYGQPNQPYYQQGPPQQQGYYAQQPQQGYGPPGQQGMYYQQGPPQQGRP